MTEISLPKMNMPITGAQNAVENAEQRALLLTQVLAAGTAADGDILENPSLAEIKVKTGAGGMGYDAASMFRLVNEITPLDVLCKDDPTGVNTIKTMTFTGTATASVDIEVGAGSSRNGLAPVSVVSGDTNEQVATKVAAAFVSKTDCVYDVAVDGTTASIVNFTYSHDGTEGNQSPVYIKGFIPGITVAIAQGTAGTGVVDTADIFADIDTTRYNMIIAPATWGATYLQTLLDARWNVSNKIMDGCAVLTKADTKANLVTLGGTLNSKGVSIFGHKLEERAWYHGIDTFENPLAISAMFAAMECLKRTDGADISEYVSSAVEQGDLIGGMHTASLPKFNSPTPLPVQNTGFGFTSTEVTELNDAGVSVIGNNSASNVVLLGEVFTMYKTDTAGNTDDSFKFKNYVDTSSACREYLQNNMKASFGQHRLTRGSTIAGLSMANETKVRSRFLSLCKYLMGVGLLQKGDEFVELIDANMTVSANTITGVVTCTVKKFPIVTQMRGLYIPIAISF